jgi:hypothetical protein
VCALFFQTSPPAASTGAKNPPFIVHPVTNTKQLKEAGFTGFEVQPPKVKKVSGGKQYHLTKHTILK